MNNVQWTYQKPWIAMCQNQMLRVIDGVPLCGTHINAAGRGPLQVVREFVLPESA